MAKKFRVNTLLLSIIIVVLALTTVSLFRLLQTDAVAEIIKNDAILKVLFVLENNGSALTTDVLFYYPPLNRGALFDVPGNTGGIFSSLGRVDRIDSVFREHGAASYAKEIASLFDQSIPFTITVSLDSLCKMADLLGGLKVFVPYPVDITNENGERVLLPSGSVTLDGEKIRTYMTYAPTDENQTEAQDRRQNVVVALLNAINTQSRYFQDKKTFKLFAGLFSANYDRDDLQRLLAEISGIDAEQLHPQSLSGSLQQVDTQQLLFPLYDGQLVKDVVKQTVTSLVSSTDTQFSRIYVLEIQNGTTTQGLARNTALLLQGFGYDVLSQGNANTTEKTMIINHIGNDEAAKSLGDLIHCENIITEAVDESADISTEALVDFTIILGRDFDGRYVR